MMLAVFISAIMMLSVPQTAFASDERTFHDMTWDFAIYAEPDFRSQRLGRFTAQAIVVLEAHDGWVKTSSVAGYGWVYTNCERMFIARPMGLFDAPGGAMISRINPQVVSIVQRYGNWLQIETWLGAKWIDLDFTPPVHELNNQLRRFGNNLSVYYRNLDTGFTYRYNTGRVYFGASISKAIFALYIYSLAEAGEICLDDTLVFTAADFNAGSGVMKYRNNFGDHLTIGELVRLNLSYSDNIATLMLVRHFGIAGYRQFVADNGGDPSRVRDRIMNSNLTANEAGLFARLIHEYIESDVEHSEQFRAHLLNNQYPFIVADHPVASKTGWTRPIAWHDMAIVYAPSPYILVIMSAREGWSARDYADFAEISRIFQEFNDTWF